MTQKMGCKICNNCSVVVGDTSAGSKPIVVEKYNHHFCSYECYDNYKKEISKKYYANEDLTKDERNLIGEGDIRVNAAKCLDCGDIIQSTYRHDFVHCSCGKIAVDGGSDYARRLFHGDGRYEDLVEYYDDVEKEDKNKAK